MVKYISEIMEKLPRNLKWGSFFVVGIRVCMVALTAITLVQVAKAQNATNQLYKVEVENIELPSLSPKSLSPVNTILIANQQGEKYIVTILATVVNYKWQIDQLSVRKDVLLTQKYSLLDHIPINLYLSEDIQLVAKISSLKEFRASSCKPNNQQSNVESIASATSLVANSQGELTLPYFIVAHTNGNVVKDNLYKGAWKININQPTHSLIKSIKVKFNQKYLSTFEILIGWQPSVD